LLQGPYFCAEDLAGIALQLDAEEAQLLGTGAVVAGAASNNVDDSGNFSIQVLSEALRRAHGVTLDQDANELAATLTTLSDGGLFAAEGDGQRPLAFVCNLREHWFAIRSLRGEVWNLNSLQVAPAKISAGYLSLYLAQLREEGYSIFQARGAPLPEPLTDLQLGRREDWFVPGQDDRRVPRAAGPASKANPLILLDDEEGAEAEDEQLQAALRESMREDVMSHGSREAAQGAAGDNLADFDDDEEEQDEALQAALALSMREHQAKLGRG
jgi:ataxin-3